MAARKVTLTIEESWLDAFRHQARKEGLTVGQWLARCGRERLPKRVAARLPEASRRGRRWHAEGEQ